MWLPYVTFLIIAGSLPLATAAAEEEEGPKIITIRPAPAPVPALKYRLLPDRNQLVPGNAAIFYHRAIEWMLSRRLYQVQQQLSLGKKEPVNEEIQERRWLKLPLDQLPKEAIRNYLAMHQVTLRETELGARRTQCDWGFQNRDEGIDLILEDIQQTRELSYLVAYQARLELAEGRPDLALHWIQMGFALAHHLGESSTTFIQTLIAASISFKMGDILEEYLQVSGASNLYWALANRPRPFLDLVKPLNEEAEILIKEFPVLKEIEQGIWSTEQARNFADEFQAKMGRMTDIWSRTSSMASRPDIKELGDHLRFATYVAKVYPEAKQALIDLGRSPAEVESMPAIQVVVLYSYRVYKEANDEIMKWVGLPHWQSYRGIEDSEQHPRGSWNMLKRISPFVMLLPAIRSVSIVPPRVDRQLDLIQTIEAIRLYAAGHDGKLPGSLDEIKGAPAPIDPITNMPFTYKKVDENTATLDAPAPAGWGMIKQFEIHYVLKLAR